MSSSKDLCVGIAGGLDRKVFGLWSWCTDWAQWHLCCGSWPRAKNFPIQLDQTQSISILSYDHWFVKNFEKFCVDRIVRSNKWVHATKNIIRLTNFPFFFLSVQETLNSSNNALFFLFSICHSGFCCCFFFQQSHVSGRIKGFFRTAHINLSFSIVFSWTGCVVISYLCCPDTWLCCS